MLLNTVLRDFCKEFDVFLLEFLDNKIKLASGINPSATQNLVEIKKLVQAGGKRIRPFLVYLSFGLFAEINDKNKLEIFGIGASLELFHTFALIHDDIIDNSLVRRNNPTIEQNYLDFFDNLEKQNSTQNGQNLTEKSGENSHNLQNLENKNQTNSNSKYSVQTQKLASSAAILAGDYAHTLADSLMNSVSSEVREIYYQMQFELVAGQIDDCFGISLENLANITQKQVLNMLICKSGNYSIQKPLLMGMTLAIGDLEKTLENTELENSTQNNSKIHFTNILRSANTYLEKKTGKNEKSLELMAKIGQDLGLVFQLVDDILGVFGEDSVTGKSVESDLVEGKKTLLIVETWANSSEMEKQIIAKNLGNPNGDFEVLRKLIEKNGLRKVQEMVDKLASESLNSVQKIREIMESQTQNQTQKNTNSQNQNWQVLLELIDYLTNRKN